MGNNYLTPDWLTSDIQQLLQTGRKGAEGGFGNTLSKSDFMDEYFKTERNPMFGDRNKFWFKDWSGASGLDDYTGGMQESGSGGFFKGGTSSDVYYYDKQDAYDSYLAAFKESGGPASYGQQEANIFDKASFLGGVERAEGITPGSEFASDPESFTGFTPEMFKKLRTEHYQPELEEKRGSLIGALTGGRETIASMGGDIAGYGRREKGVQDIESQYESGVGDIYTGIEQQKAQGLQSIYDVLSQYEDLGAA